VDAVSILADRERREGEERGRERTMKTGWTHSSPLLFLSPLSLSLSLSLSLYALYCARMRSAPGLTGALAKLFPLL
jgi:uncharacterized membrane protein